MLQQTMPAVAGAILMHSGATVLDALTAFTRNRDKQTVFVLDRDMKYRGNLSRHTIFEFISDYLDFIQGGNPATVADRLKSTSLENLIETKPEQMSTGNSLKDRIVRLLCEDTDAYPVLDRNGRITGEITSSDITEELLSALRGR